MNEEEYLFDRIFNLIALTDSGYEKALHTLASVAAMICAISKDTKNSSDSFVELFHLYLTEIFEWE